MEVCLPAASGLGSSSMLSCLLCSLSSPPSPWSQQIKTGKITIGKNITIIRDCQRKHFPCLKQFCYKSDCPLWMLSIVNWLTNMTYIPFKEQRGTEGPRSSIRLTVHSSTRAKLHYLQRWALTRLTLQPHMRGKISKKQFDGFEDNLLKSFLLWFLTFYLLLQDRLQHYRFQTRAQTKLLQALHCPPPPGNVCTVTSYHTASGWLRQTAKTGAAHLRQGRSVAQGSVHGVQAHPRCL